MSASQDLTENFSDEQKQYLSGFLSGLDALRSARGLAELFAPAGEAAPVGPDAAHMEAQKRTEAGGGKLVKEEQAKRDKHPFDMWSEMRANAAAGEFPDGTDVFRYKFHGLFYTAPNQDSFMCRLRLPNGILDSYQFRGVAALAERHGGGYTHVTTRANLQLREIPASDGVSVLTGLQDLGIVNRGSGADNIRNITGHPTAGIDPLELIDTRALCREMHYHILYHRELYGLPRKLNIAFDGGGAISVVEDTNDIAFAAVRVAGDNDVPDGVYFRLLLGGLPGHGGFANDTGVLLRPEECVPVADAVLRIFIEHGDRTNRKKARLKYLIDAWGLEAYMTEVAKRLPFELRSLPLQRCEARPSPVAGAHIGVHPQSAEGRHYIGVVLPMGKLSVDQMRGLADIADRYGSSSLRLTVWQNLLVPDIGADRVDQVKQAIENLGLHWSASNVRAGLVACTGNFGCRFSSSDTKAHGAAVAEHIEAHLDLDRPINIHVTGCPNSCAQHHISDIGLLGTQVEIDDDNMAEGYDVFVGGGFGEQKGLGERLYPKIVAEDVPALVERMLRAYLDHRAEPGETFRDFARRYGVAGLKPLIEAQSGSQAA